MKLITFILLNFLVFSLYAKKFDIDVYTEQAFPLQYTKNGKIKGAATELLQAVLKKANVSYTIKIQPWARIFNIALHKKNVLIYSIARTKQREHSFQWIGSILKLNYFLYGFTDHNISFNPPLSQLQHYLIAVGRKSATAQYLKNENFNHLYSVNNANQMVKMLLAKRVDLISVSNFTFYHTCKKFKLDCSDVKPLYKLSAINNELFYAMSKLTDKTLVNRIRIAYKQVIKNHISIADRANEIFMLK